MGCDEVEHRREFSFGQAEGFPPPRVGEECLRLPKVNPVEVTGSDVHEVKDLAGGRAEREEKLVALRSPTPFALNGNRAVCEELEGQMSTSSRAVDETMFM